MRKKTYMFVVGVKISETCMSEYRSAQNLTVRTHMCPMVEILSSHVPHCKRQDTDRAAAALLAVAIRPRNNNQEIFVYRVYSR